LSLQLWKPDGGREFERSGLSRRRGLHIKDKHRLVLVTVHVHPEIRVERGVRFGLVDPDRGNRRVLGKTDAGGDDRLRRG